MCAKIYCESCGAEVKLPEKSEMVIGMSVSKESKGNYVLPMEQTNNIVKEKENKTMNNMNMNGFDIEALAKMVATQLQANQTNVATQYAQNADVTRLAEVDKVDKNHWAENSKFYGKEICGYAYNPYMIRRFLPAQFNQLITAYKGNVHKGITKKYPYMYSITYTLEEVRKLVMLHKRDMIAYSERRMVFTLDECKSIFMQYVDDVLEYFTKQNDEFVAYNRVGREYRAGFKGYGYMFVGTVAEKIEHHKVVKYLKTSEQFNMMMEDLMGLKRKIGATYNYEQLYKIFFGRDLIKIPAKTKKSSHFMDCFIKAGSYYTLKQQLMFDNKVLFKGYSGREAVVELRRYLDRGYEGYKIYAMLKEVNNIR